MKITVYGLKNCDTCRKAVKWLATKGADVRLHDVRADGLPKSLVNAWLKAFGPEIVINRRGTTWRNLTDAEKTDLSKEKALNLLTKHPSLLKRPVFDLDGTFVIGFKAQEKSEIQRLL